MMSAPVCPIARLERLLLSTDGSEFSEGAIQQGIALAKLCSSKVYALSVIETNPEFSALAPDLVEKAEKETAEHLESVRARAEKEGLDCEIMVRRGPEPYKYIVDEASKLEADLIIMGIRGRKGISKLMMGSVTALVIGHASCHVLVVPKAAELTFKKIMIATDGSEYSKKAAREAISIAKRCGSSVVALSVAPNEPELKAAEDSVNYVKGIADNEGIAIETFSVVGNPYEAITTTAQVRDADLIMVGSHGKSALMSFLMGGVAERVIALAHCAVLVVR